MFVVGCSNEMRLVEDANTMLQAELEKSKNKIKELNVKNAKLAEENQRHMQENKRLKTDIVKFATELKPKLIEFTTENKRLKEELKKLKEKRFHTDPELGLEPEPDKGKKKENNQGKCCAKRVAFHLGMDKVFNPEGV